MATRTTEARPDYLRTLRKETKAEVRAIEAKLKALHRFEQMINPQARPRRKRAKS